MSLPIALLLAAAAPLGDNTPQLLVNGPTVVGQPLSYELQGTAPVVGLFEGLALGSALFPTPFPLTGEVNGDLFLSQLLPAPAGLILEFDANSQFTVGLPEIPVLIGFTIYAQGFGFVPAEGVFLLSDVATVVLDPPAPEGLSYSENPALYIVGTPIVNNTASVTWPVDNYSIDPALPNGLSLDATTGVISGTSTQVVPETVYTVTASNVTGSTSVDVTITSDPAVPAAISYSDNPVIYVVGDTITPNNAIVVGVVDSFSIAPDLPDGLSLDETTGRITGTPTTITAAADYTVTATNVTGSLDGTVNITVNPATPVALSYSDPAILYTNGAAIPNNVPTFTGVVETFAINPTPPNGLSFDTLTGVLSGTPIGTSPFIEYTITAANVTGSIQANISFSVETFATPQLSLIGGGQLGETLDYQMTGTTNVAGQTEVLTIDFQIIPSGAYAPGFGLIFLAQTAASQSFIGDGSHLWSVPVPADPGLLGIDYHAQAFGFVFAGFSGQQRLSNLVTTEITLPQPENLDYPVDSVLALLGEPIDPVTPTVDNLVDSYSIAPSLPSGLAIDPITGTIAGAPTAQSPETVYTVTATNLAGTDTTDITLTVLESLQPRFAYVPTDDGTLGIYTVNANTGQLTHRGYELVGSNPSDVAVLEGGTAAFVANAGDDTISAFGGSAITGALNLLDTAVTGGDPTSLAIESTNSYLYAACSGASNGLYAFAIGAGTLSPIPGSPFGSGTEPTQVAASNSSNIVLALGDFNGSPVLRSYAANANGVLASISTLFVGAAASDVELSPDDAFAYVANRGDNTISVFSVAPNGVLAELNASPFSSAGGPAELAITPTGEFLFAGNANGTVRRFSVAGDGSISSLGSTTAVGTDVTGLAVDASSSFLYAADGPSNEVLTYDISGSGGLSKATPIDGVRVRPGPSAVALSAGISPVAISSTRVYVGNQSTSQLNQYDANLSSGELDALIPPTAGAFDGPSSLSLHPDGALGASAFLGANSIGAYFVSPVSGALTPNLPATPVDESPWSVLNEPSGRFAYVTHSTLVGGGVQPLTWNLAISMLSAGTTVGAGNNQTRKLAIDPAGRFLYAPNQADDTISQFAIDIDTGVLTELSPATVGAGDAPLDVTVHPNGRFAFAPDFGSSNVTAYSIDADTGALTFLANVPTSGSNGQAIAVHPEGRFMYVANAGTNDISILSVNPQTGAASETASASAPAEARGLAFDASGFFLYVTIGGPVDAVTKYSVNPATGNLTEGGSVQAGDQPREVVTDRLIE